MHLDSIVNHRGQYDDLRHNDSDWDSFHGWKKRGYGIKKGSKATKIAGLNKFYKDSVYKCY